MITGAGGGLGKEYALLLASRGARVLVNDIGGSVTGAGSDTAPRPPRSRRSSSMAVRRSPTPAA